MLAPVRVATRTRFTFRYFASTVLFTALIAAACSDDGPTIAGGAAGSAGRAGNGGTNAGGVGGESDQGGEVASAGSANPGNESGSDAGGQSVGGQSGQAGDGGHPEPSSGGGGEGGADGSSAGAGGEPPGSEDAQLPCAIKNLLSARCQGCHANPPVPGTSVQLLTHADLIAPSKSDATVSVAARSLMRMKDTLAPMPPSPATHATTEEIATLRTWIEAGTPRGECNYDPNDPNANPYDAPAQCTSGRYWTGNDTGANWMMPGRACLSCHRQMGNFAPQFSVAGTVFPTAHEPDKCYGVPLATGAKIVITDANGQELPVIDVVSSGNFGVIFPDFARPYRAKIVVGDRERVMLTPQTNGDCNACHTQNGAQGALGRIIVP